MQTKLTFELIKTKVFVNMHCDDVFVSRIKNILNVMAFKCFLLWKNDYEVLKTMFNNLVITAEKRTNVVLKKFLEMQKRDVIDPIDILRPISIVISLLTIHDGDRTTLEEMFSLVEENNQKKSILLNQTMVWWGKNVSVEDVEGFVRIFRKYLERDKETTMLIRQVKELFCKNIKNSRELSKIIDKYLIPQENEKKKNAEVSTPMRLRREMLETIPEEFWREKRKVLEPCCGKGGFLMDIVDKFMLGLKDEIEDEKQMYKEIVEECIYFSDINEMNIFICRLLLDPYNEYDLKFNQGDTLKLDIKEKWGLEKFDAVIGNPPYQKNYDNQNGRVGGSSLWSEFINTTFPLVQENGYFLFITPCSWMTGSTNKQSGNILQGIFQKNTMMYLDIEKCGKHFNVGSTFSYYLIQKHYADTPFRSVVLYKNKVYTSIIDQKVFRRLHAIPKLFTNDTISIIQKVEKKSADKFSFLRIRTHDTCSKRKVYCESGKFRIRHKVVCEKHTNTFQKECMNRHKLVISMPGYLKPTYDYESGCSDATMYMLVKDQKHSEYLITLLESPLYKFVTNNYRELTGLNNHYNINRLSIIPEGVDDPYAYFDITENEKELILKTTS